MIDKGSSLDGFAALYDGTGNSETTICESVQTKCVVDYECVLLCQQHGWQAAHGVPLGTLAELWPFDLLKRQLVAHAAEFVRQIKPNGFDPVASIYSFKIWGPYMEKVGEIKQWTPEAGNPLIPKHEQRKAVQVWGYQGDEFDFNKGCAFLIQGDFTRHARHGHLDEETGRIFV